MDTYLNVYKGYYVSDASCRIWKHADMSSSPATVLAVTTKATTGSEVVWMTLSTFLDTGCRRQKLKPPSLSIVRLPNR